MTDVVLYEERDDIAIITLNRPEKRNALNEAVIAGIADGIDAATASRDVVAVVLRGAAGTLTAGYDLSPEQDDSPPWSTPYGARGPAPREGAWDPVRDYQFMGNNVRRFARRFRHIPPNQLALNKLLINQAFENMGLRTTQMLGTFFDGVTRHTEEALQWAEDIERRGLRDVVADRDRPWQDYGQRPRSEP